MESTCTDRPVRRVDCVRGAARTAHSRRGDDISELELVVVSEGGDLLLNAYAVIHPRGAETAAAFADWLTRGDGRQRIERHLIEGRVAFHVWPDKCPGARPDALPCS